MASKFLSGKRIKPTRIGPGLTVTELVDGLEFDLPAPQMAKVQAAQA